MYITFEIIAIYNYIIDYKRRCNVLGKLIINKDNEKISSINRTIRINPKVFDKLMELSEKNNISFNKVINKCLEYALDNLDENG